MFFKKAILIVTLLALSSAAHAVHARELDLVPGDIKTWDAFQHQVDLREHVERSSGTMYMITGAVVAVGGGVLAAQSGDSLTRLTLSLIESVGIGGIGYGAALANLDGRDQMIRDMIVSTPSLSKAQRDQMIQTYMQSVKENARKRRLIMAITYGLVAAFNTVNATNATDNTTRDIYWGVAGINAALGLAYTF